MEAETDVEMPQEIKCEIEDADYGETSEEKQHSTDVEGDLNLKEDEIWIKPDIEEEPDPARDEQDIKIEIEVEFAKKDGDTQDPSKLPLKKRKQSPDGQQKDLITENDIKNEEGNEKVESEANNENNEQSENNDDKPKEKWIMYSYEITKNIQIVTITEEERRVEHTESMKARRHMKHVCEDCAVGFVLEHAYLMHMKIHSKESGDHECDLCHTYLKSADMLYRHKLRHYRRYRCLLCWTRFKDKDTAACHVMTDHVGTAFDCDYCGKGFKRPQYLKRHVEQHHTKPHRLECAVCFRVFHERGWYRSHIRTHNEEIRNSTIRVPANCDICSRSFKSKASLKRHLATHDAEHVECDICFDKFKNTHALGQHYLNVHNEKYDGAPEVTCKICLRVCATRAMLKRHTRRMHSDRTKNYQCDHCSRYYLTKGEVRAHITWSHLPPGVRGGHACACGRQFRTRALLREHAARHHEHVPPARNHACDLCGKAFSNKQVLNRHKKSHSNEMYPCNECGLLFKTQPYVKVHYQIKHLNMTRAQINAQRKLNKNKIPQNNLHTGPKTNDIDPLAIEDKVQIKLEKEDVQVPLFQTFNGVDRN
ncbi:zinc finger Y-chromosomal protein 1-like [Anticarsia gemmatalis]|uniref:zinc finger Y-chromosomal protein 1-like n=1 Tax=Anticarsia gemmatalis TaxID=129554 RepID=UPI003F76C875